MASAADLRTLVQQEGGSFDCEAGAPTGQRSERSGCKKWAAYVSVTVALGMVAGALAFMVMSHTPYPQHPVKINSVRNRHMAFFAPSMRFSGAVARPTISQRAIAPRAAVEGIKPTATEEAAATEAKEEDVKKIWNHDLAYYSNDKGSWFLNDNYELPEGMMLSPDAGLVPAAAKERQAPEQRPLPFGEGIFAPIVKGAASVAGRKELNKIRADVIAKHTKVISNFVDTSGSAFGQIALKRMFKEADKDGNGALDKQEVYHCLYDLGFKFVEAKDIDKFFKKADEDGNAVIDFEEFSKEAPKTIRLNLIKLAKTNGHDLGFLA
jgi:hypothetical protein